LSIASAFERGEAMRPMLYKEFFAAAHGRKHGGFETGEIKEGKANSPLIPS